MRRVTASCALAVLALAFACSGGPPQIEAPGRVLIVGIDGANMRVIAPLLEQGRLPNLARIAREGVHGNLRSLKPLLSPRIWNSIATGKRPEKHGILQFAREDESGTQQLLLSTDRKAHALWNIASDAGLSVAVVNFWNTYPPERVNGVMVSDHLLAKEVEGRRLMSKAEEPESTGPLVYPQSWLPRLSATMEDDVPPVAFEDPFLGNTRLPKWWITPDKLSRRFKEDGALAEFALLIEASERPDLAMVLFTGIDRISHNLWGTLEPPELYPERLRPSDDQREAGRTAIERYYEYSDALIGALLEGYGPEDLVVVVSDHGFEAGVGLAFLTGVHESDAAINGVVFARGPGIPAGGGSQGMTVLDVTPTVLAWLGLPVAEDMDGRVASFLEVDEVARIPSYDVSPVERVSDAPSGANDQLVDQLRALGYIE